MPEDAKKLFNDEGGLLWENIESHADVMVWFNASKQKFIESGSSESQAETLAYYSLNMATALVRTRIANLDYKVSMVEFVMKAWDAEQQNKKTQGPPPAEVPVDTEGGPNGKN